jgi:cutinase
VRLVGPLRRYDTPCIIIVDTVYRPSSVNIGFLGNPRTLGEPFPQEQTTEARGRRGRTMRTIGLHQARLARGLKEQVGAVHIARVVAVAGLATSALGPNPLIDTASVSADPCADVEVVFARGTGEPPGVGEVGQAFVDSVRSKVGGRSLGVYAVNYPATIDFPTALDGIDDAGHHVEHMSASCPNTNMVLGGFSQGAAVMGFVTSDAIPDGAPATAPTPMPPDVANHVAAIALFGTPSQRFMNAIGAPPIIVGPLYLPKTTELCAAGDPICSDGGDWGAHTAYTNDGMVDQAASYAASRLSLDGASNPRQVTKATSTP